MSDGKPVVGPHMTKPVPARPWLDPVLRLTVLAFAVIVILLGVREARPPRSFTIEVGPVGGSYYDNAMRYRAALAERGIDLRIVPTQNSLDIVKDVATPGSGIDAGFMAQDVNDVTNPGASVLGLVQLQPLFIFASADLGRRSVIDDLRGRKIVLLPPTSVTTAAALKVFELYDITPDNTSFTYLPLADAVRELRAGRFDAGAFILAPENKVIRDMAGDSALQLIPTSEAHAIANHLPFLEPVELPRGIYSIADAIPANDTPMLAARVAVIVRKGLHPWLIYSLLDAMSKAHRGATLISGAGDFPTIVGSPMEVNPLAERWYRVGVPWTWNELPPGLAGFVDRYALLLMAALLLSGIVISVACVTDLAGLAVTVLAWVRGRRKPE